MRKSAKKEQREDWRPRFQHKTSNVDWQVWKRDANKKERSRRRERDGEREIFIQPYRVGVTFCTWLWNRTAEEHSHTYAHTQDWHTSTLHTNTLFDGRLGDRTGTCTQAHTQNNQTGSSALKTSLCDVQSSGICIQRQRERRCGNLFFFFFLTKQHAEMHQKSQKWLWFSLKTLLCCKLFPQLRWINQLEAKAPEPNFKKSVRTQTVRFLDSVHRLTTKQFPLDRSKNKWSESLCQVRT